MRDAYRELSDFVDKYPDSNYVERRQEAAPRGAAPPDRARGLRGALLPGHAGIPRRPSCAWNRRCAATPSRGARPSCCWCWAQTHLRDGQRRARRGTTFTRVVQEFGSALARPSGRSCSWSSSASGTATDQDGPPEDRSAPPWMSGLDGCCERGREHYATGDYDKAERALMPIAAGPASRSPTCTRCWASSTPSKGLQQDGPRRMFEEALRLNPGYTEAAINLAVTYNDAGQYQEARDVYKRMIAAPQGPAARHVDPFVKGQAGQHARRAWPLAYEQAGLLRRGDPGVPSGRWPCVPSSSTCAARLAAGLPGDRRPGGGRRASSRGSRRKTPTWRGPRLQLGHDLLRRGPAQTTRPASGARCWPWSRPTSSPSCTCG